MHVPVALLLAATALAGLTGCAHSDASSPAAAGSPSPTTTGSASVVPSPAAVVGDDLRDPADVCRRFTAALYSADTTRDHGPQDAYVRAGAFMTPTLYAVTVAAASDGRWATWAAHRAALHTHLVAWVDDEQPPDSSISAYRAEQASVTPIGADGWNGGTQTVVVYCTLAHVDTSAGWRVADYDQALRDTP